MSCDACACKRRRDLFVLLEDVQIRSETNNIASTPLFIIWRLQAFGLALLNIALFWPATAFLHFKCIQEQGFIRGVRFLNEIPQPVFGFFKAVGRMMLEEQLCFLVGNSRKEQNGHR